MKKILFIAYYYPPIKSGGSQRPLNFIKYLNRNKYKVTLLTSSYKNSTFKKDIIRVFDISFNKDRSGFRFYVWLFLRALTEIMIKIGLYRSIYSWWKNSVIRKNNSIIDYVKPDLIIVSYPPVETMEIGLFLSIKYNIPLISDFRDGLLFEPIEINRINKYKIIKNKYRKIEEQIVNQSKAIISVSDPISYYFKEKYGYKNIATIYTGYDPDDYIQKITEETFFDKTKFNILFTGRLSLTDKNNKSIYFFDAVRELIRENKEIINKIQIHLIGEFDSDDFDVMDDLIGEGIVIHHGHFLRKKVLQLQPLADLLLAITLPDKSSFISTKIFEYLKSGKAILALTHKTTIEELIIKTKTGWVVHPFKKDLIKQLLIKIITNKSFYNSIIADKNQIKYYSVENQIKDLVIIINQLLKRK